MVQLAAHMYESPRDILVNVNRRIFDGIERKSFITMILAKFDVARREVVICRAGHNKALISSSGRVEQLNAAGIGLGLERGSVFDSTLEEVRRPLVPGGRFLFYTDGLTEAMDSEQREFGEEAVVSLVDGGRSLPSAELQESILRAVEGFRGEAEQHDDITMVVVGTR
jgi:serine phosphatase RsbU (regulator of sigma subunit)